MDRSVLGLRLEYDSAAVRSTPIAHLLEVVRYRDLLHLLVVRSIKTRYKRSVLGVAWTLLNPLVNMLVMSIAFSALFRPAIPSYPVYIEAVKFFHVNALSSPILTKVHFDVVVTLMADTLRTILARKLRGFEDCDAPKLYRHFVNDKGTVILYKSHVAVTFPRRAHNPILRNVAWDKLPLTLPGPPQADLSLRFS